MTAPVGRWRATYTPGDWTVLAGPTSVVVLEPVTRQWASLVPALWDEVVESASLVDLAAQLAAYRLDTMPSFAAFFWTEDGMRSLVRGRIRVLDPTTGSVVADGDGIQTWSEVGLGDLTQVEVELGTGEPDPAGPSVSLPLVVGAVRAASLLLDASDEAQVFSPQGLVDDEDTFEDYSEIADNFTDEAGADEGEEMETDGATTELMTDPFLEPEGAAEAEVDPDAETEAEVDPDAETEAEVDPDAETEAADDADTEPESELPFADDPDLLDSIENGDTQLMPPAPSAPAGVASVSPDSLIMAVVCPYGHSSPQNATLCRVCGTAIAPQGPQLVPRPALALLRASDGSTVEVDRAVLLGRAPAAHLSNARGPRLMTVPSPGHDISRTHVEVAPDGWQIVVTDLRSTNGTVLVRPGSGERQQLPPGQPVPVPLQSLLELGDGVSVLVDFPQ